MTDVALHQRVGILTMAKPSKRYPWVLEVYVPALDKWYDVEAFRDKDEAEMQAQLKRKRDPEVKLRVTEYRS